MNKTLLWILTGSLSLFSEVNAEPPDGYQFVPFDEGLRIAGDQNRRMFLYFGRHGCTWCDITNQKAFSNPRVRELYSDNYVLVYVDTEGGNRLRLPSGERLTEAELGARLKVLATPLFVFTEPNAKPVARTSGIKTDGDLVDMHLYVSGNHFQRLRLREFQDARRNQE